LSRKQITRIKKIIKYELLFLCTNKFSELTLTINYVYENK